MKRLTLLVSILAAVCATTLFAQNTIPPFPTRPVPKAEGAGTQNLDVAAWEKLRAGTNWVVLDVRSPAEFEGGHIPGALNVDFRSKTFADEVTKLDKSKSYLVYCGSGYRSARACTQMSGLKFKETANLLGGIGAWTDAGNKTVGPGKTADKTGK